MQVSELLGAIDGAYMCWVIKGVESTPKERNGVWGLYTSQSGLGVLPA